MKINRPIIFWNLVLCCVFILPISQFICIRLIIVTLLFSFFVNDTKRERQNSFISNTWDVSLYLIVLIAGLAYSEDISLGLSVLETNFSFLGLSIILNKIDFDKKKLHHIFLVFSCGVIVASLIFLVSASINFINTKDVHVFFFYQLTDVLDFQPTYFAYYIIFILSFGLYILYFHQVSINYKLILSTLFFLFVVLMLTGGLTSFISILLILSFFVLKFLVDEKTKIRTRTFVVVLVMIAGMFLFSYVYKSLDSQTTKITDYWERMTLWESAIKANPNWLLGVGTGDYKKELNRFYISHDMVQYASENYNSHNQFIQVLFSNGAIGLVAVAFLLGRPFYLSVRNQNVLGALTFFPFLIYGMTEVFLGRFQGVVFFAFLHQCFVLFYSNSHAKRETL